MIGYLWRRIRRTFNWFLIRRAIRHWWQRRTRGWDDSDTWALHFSLAQMILPRLKRFRDLNIGFPPCFETFEEWQATIDEMIKAFEFLGSEDYWSANFKDPRYKQADKGLKLFAKWYQHLWW